MPSHRRRFLSHAFQAISASAFSVKWLSASESQAGSGKSSGLIVRSRRPLDLETPVDQLDSEFTPNPWFFVRSHFGEPAVNTQGWSVTLDGLFQSEKKFKVAEIMNGFPRHERPAVLMCAGNGRGLMKPIVPGLPWEHGASGQAIWSGLRLKDLIEALGLKDGAKHLIFETADPTASKMTPSFTRSLPLERLLQDDVLLVDRMNGEPLPLLHGGPLRLVVPTWTGNHWVKWVKRITASAEESLSDFQRKSYKMPTLALAPSVAPTPDQLKSVTILNVKSQLTWPTENAQISARDSLTIRGSAWTGPGLVTRVEVRTSLNSAWQTARIVTQNPDQGAWVRWEFTIADIKPGQHFVEVRATDSNGHTQPVDPFWNRSGYLYNAIERVPFQVIG